MKKIKHFIGKNQIVLLNIWLVASFYLVELLLFAVSKQSISLQSFILDIFFYSTFIVIINFNPNIKIKKILLLIFTTILIAVMMADTLYVSFYRNYASIGAVADIGNVVGGQNNDMGLRLIWATIVQASILALNVSLIICSTFPALQKGSKQFRTKALALFTLISCLSLYNYSLFYSIQKKTFASTIDYYESDTFLYDSLYSSKLFVKKYGYINFRCRDALLRTNDMPYDNIQAYFSGKENKQSNGYTGVFEDYNVINILSETFDTKIISFIDHTLKNNDTPLDDNLVEELMPTYYSLYNGTAGDSYGWDSGSLYFENYYTPAFSEGCTINSEFMSLVSMYPYTNRYWSVNIGSKYGNTTFKPYSLPSMLNNRYETYYFHANVGSFYNRTQLMPNIGFEHSYFQDSHEMANIVDDDFIYYDENLMGFFSLVDTSKPFYVSALTFSGHLGNESHYPDKDNRATNLYNVLSDDWDPLIVKEETNNNFNLYLRKLIYFDDFLNSLLDWIDTTGETKTIINIYPDHYNYGLCSADMTGELYKEYFGVAQSDNEVHHMALTTFIADGFSDYKDEDGSKKIIYSDYMATIDLTPTILNWLEKDTDDFDYKHFFGNDYFDNPDDNYVYFQNLSLWMNGIEYNLSDNKVIKRGNDYYSQIQLIAVKDKLSEILEKLNICKSIINQNYYEWLLGQK